MATICNIASIVIDRSADVFKRPCVGMAHKAIGGRAA